MIPNARKWVAATDMCKTDLSQSTTKTHSVNYIHNSWKAPNVQRTRLLSYLSLGEDSGILPKNNFKSGTSMAIFFLAIIVLDFYWWKDSTCFGNILAQNGSLYHIWHSILDRIKWQDMIQQKGFIWIYDLIPHKRNIITQISAQLHDNIWFVAGISACLDAEIYRVALYRL